MVDLSQPSAARRCLARARPSGPDDPGERPRLSGNCVTERSAPKKDRSGDGAAAAALEMPLLLADEDEWVGHVGTLSLAMRPGVGLLEADAVFGDSARQALEIAAAAALGRERARVDLCFRVRLPPGLPTHVIDGDSVGLVAATLCAAAARGEAPPQQIGLTGRVDLQGRTGPAGGLRLKAKAAKEAGFERLITGAGCEPTDELPADEVLTLDALWSRLWPRRRRASWIRALALLLLGPALSLLGLSAVADHRLCLLLLRATSAPVPAAETAIIALPETERSPNGALKSFRERRARLPVLLDQLVAAGARSVSLDVALNRADPADAALARSVTAAAAQGVPVILTARWLEGQGPWLPADPALNAVITAGQARLSQAEGEGEGQRVLEPGRLRVRRWADRWIWHAAVETVASWTPRVGAPRLGDGPEGRDMLIIGPIRVNAPGERVTLRPVEPSPCWLWVEAGWSAPNVSGCPSTGELAGQPALAGRAVWIGVRSQDDAFTLFGEPVAGVDVQAAATEVIAAGAAPRELGLAANALIAAAMGPLWALGRSVARPGLGADLALGGVAIGALAGAAVLGWLVGPIPALVSAAAGLLAYRMISK